jgi:cytochrome c oxidase subunit 4
MSHHDSSHGHGNGHPAVGHVVPIQVLFAVLGSLLVLTVVTVAVTWVDLGRLNLWVALAIATFKASLVVLFFMHLKYDKPFNAIILIVSFALIMLFIAIALTDTHGYGPDQIPGYAPKMQAPAAP